MTDTRPRIAIVDYGAGNLTSVRKAFRYVGADPVLVRAPGELQGVAAIVVPGVGHFGATRALDSPWQQAVRGAANHGVPLLGICLGLQWFFDRSEESPQDPGLGLLPGTCTKLQGAVKIPHVGWNSLEVRCDSPLLRGLANQAVYFTHSYVAPVTDACVASTHYGSDFASVVAAGSVAGVQWHPEKSGDAGLQLLRNFLDMVRAC